MYDTVKKTDFRIEIKKEYTDTRNRYKNQCNVESYSLTAAGLIYAGWTIISIEI